MGGNHVQTPCSSGPGDEGVPVLDHAQADGALSAVATAGPRRAADRTLVERAGCMGTKLQQEDAHVVPKLAVPDRRGLQTFLRPPFPGGTRRQRFWSEERGKRNDGICRGRIRKLSAQHGPRTET
jgi:hypothetical protein